MNASPNPNYTDPSTLALRSITAVSQTEDCIRWLAEAILALDHRTAQTCQTPATDPGLSHPCGCEPTTARYPCDPISVPLTPTGEKALEELWACLELIAYEMKFSNGYDLLHRPVWAEVQRRAKALFPDRSL
jgi:hypothetical protein